jgi:hypothetical protein
VPLTARQTRYQPAYQGCTCLLCTTPPSGRARPIR